MELPENFLIGAATAAHQVEGNNTNSDYWAMEHMEHTSFAEPSLDAVDHYNRYEEDIRLLAAAGLNAYRFSIEWARIEPEQGKFDPDAVEHYRKVLRCCRENGVTPIVTLMHFTSPLWLIRKGGWEAESTVQDFANYAAYIAEELGEELGYVVTINEANMGLQLAAIAKRYIRQMLMPKKKSRTEKDTAQVGINMKTMLKNMSLAGKENEEIFGTKSPQTFVSQRTAQGDILIMRAHRAAVRAMKAIRPELRIGLSLSLHDIQAEPGAEKAAEKEWNEEFLHYLPYIFDDDFLGVQNYTRTRMGKHGALTPEEHAELTQMGYEFYPEALANVLRKVHETFHGDLIVTENGIAVSDDTRRCEFICCALSGVEQVVEEGLPVKGYCYWSLLDNFEWQKGFTMTFGLIAVDRSTQKRSPKPSLQLLGSLRKEVKA